MTRIPLTEAMDKLPELTELTRAGASFALVKDGNVIAVLGPPESQNAGSASELAARVSAWPKLSAEAADEFARGVEEAIAAGNRQNGNVAWPS